MEILEYYFLKEEDKEKPTRTWNDGYRRLVFAQEGIGKAPKLSHLEEVRLIKRAREGCEDANKKLFQAFSQMAASFAQQAALRCGRPDLAEEMFSQAMQDLFETILKFDFDRNARLSVAFASKAVGNLQQLGLVLAKPMHHGCGSDERKAFYNHGKLMKLFRRAKRRPFNGTKSDFEILSSLCGIPPKALKRGIESRQIKTIPISRVEITSPGKTAESQAISKETHDILSSSVSCLKEAVNQRDWHIFSSLSQEDAPSKVELGAKHGISPERAGQIYKKCISILRKDLARKGYHTISDLA